MHRANALLAYKFKSLIISDSDLKIEKTLEGYITNMLIVITAGWLLVWFCLYICIFFSLFLVLADFKYNVQNDDPTIKK